jgi:hypothetical protein
MNGQVLGQAGDAGSLLVDGVTTKGWGKLLNLLVQPNREALTKMVGVAADVALKIPEIVLSVLHLLVGCFIALNDGLEAASHVLFHPGAESLILSLLRVELERLVECRDKL